MTNWKRFWASPKGQAKRMRSKKYKGAKMAHRKPDPNWKPKYEGDYQVTEYEAKKV